MGSRRRSFKAATAVVAMTAIVGAGLQPASAYPRPGFTELVSVASDGTQAEYLLNLVGCGWYAHSNLTPDGRYVVFQSTAHNLDDGDLNAAQDVFLRDRKTKKTELVSVSSLGIPVIGPSCSPSISATGRYVAFASKALNLVQGDTNLAEDTFVRDRKNGSTERVSVNSAGEQAKGFSVGGPSISADGRYVGFHSSADNLVENDTNNGWDAFVHDRKTGKTIRISVNSKGEEADRGSLSAAFISGNGRFAAFMSSSTNLVSDDTNGSTDVFVHDLKSRKTVLVSVASDGAQASGALYSQSGGSAISANGRYVTFISSNQSLVPNDANRLTVINYPPIDRDGTDAFVHDRKTGRTERVSVTSYGEEREHGGFYSHISPNGRYIGFNALNPPDDGSLPGTPEIHVYDRAVGVLTWATSNVEGEQSPNPDTFCKVPRFNPVDAFLVEWSDAEGPEARGGGVGDDGDVVFSSCKTDLTTDDSNEADDYFVRDFGPSLGVSGFGGPPPGDEPPDDRICITPDICIPPQAAVTFKDQPDDVDEVVSERGANLIGGSIARPAMEDLYTVLELESMPRTPALAAATAGLVYGMSFEVDGDPYEVRVASTGLGIHGETTASFGLFSCPPTEFLCTKVTDLRGGFGTTGERIVFSLPLNDVGLDDGSAISGVKVFTALGSSLGGAVETLDEARP